MPSRGTKRKTNKLRVLEMTDMSLVTGLCKSPNEKSSFSWGGQFGVKFRGVIWLHQTVGSGVLGVRRFQRWCNPTNFTNNGNNDYFSDLSLKDPRRGAAGISARNSRSTV